MTFDVSCYWADNCASYNISIEVSSVDELLEKVEEMFEDACGISGVEGFYNEWLDREEFAPYEWDNMDLKRNRNLSDVWHKERKNIKEYFGEVFDS